MVECAAPAGAAAFDWYAATIYDDEDAVLQGLEYMLGGNVVEALPMHGYERGFAIKTPGGIAARVLTGGNGGKPHAWGGGAAGEDFAAAVRGEWGGAHHVTRLDSRFDFFGDVDGWTWDRLYAACVELAAERGLKTSLAGDYLARQDGRTLYIGSRKSQVFVRLYEKGKQLRRELREAQREAVPVDWCRLELQARPSKDARFEAATLAPVEAWGMSKWTKALVADIHQLELAAVTMQVRRESDDERALGWMGVQYGGMLQRLAESEPRGWEGVLDRVIASVAAAQRRAGEDG